MSASLPLTLLAAFSLLVGFVNSQQRHIQGFRGSSPGVRQLLMLSTILGSICGAALLVFYFMQVAWYWPVLLFVAAAVVGGIVFGILDRVIGAAAVSMAGFIGWPAAAIWAYYLLAEI